MAIFPTFSFRQFRPGKCLYDIFERKNGFPSYKNKRLINPKTEIFPKGLNYAFGQKMALSPSFFFFGNIEQENVFYDILERKNAFASYKNKKLKQSKN